MLEHRQVDEGRANGPSLRTEQAPLPRDRAKHRWTREAVAGGPAHPGTLRCAAHRFRLRRRCNQRGRLLEWVLLARGNERIFTVSAPWYAGERT
jgi:hypothetical protein